VTGGRFKTKTAPSRLTGRGSSENTCSGGTAAAMNHHRAQTNAQQSQGGRFWRRGVVVGYTRGNAARDRFTGLKGRATGDGRINRAQSADIQRNRARSNQVRENRAARDRGRRVLVPLPAVATARRAAWWRKVNFKPRLGHGTKKPRRAAKPGAVKTNSARIKRCGGAIGRKRH